MSEETEVTTEEEISTEQGQQETQTDAIEERARTMGWVPKDEFRGDESRWVDADEFVKRGETELPVLRERYRKLETKLHDVEKTLKEFAEHHKTVSEREYKKALTDIKRQKAEAVELGNKEAFERAEAQEEELRAHKPKEIKVEASDGVHPDFPAWVADNQWYQTDRAARAVADDIARELVGAQPHLQGVALFNAVKEQVKKELPSKFENPRRKQPPAVEGGTNRTKKGGKSYSDLPAEAKSACDKFVKQGLMTQEQYVKEYDWS